jgi:hypothetical protein
MMVLANVTFGQISVDAGLTPAEDRWIFRLQTRFMERETSFSSNINYMQVYSVNAVVAYGIMRDLTLIVRSIHQFTETMMGENKSSFNGFGDLTFITKYSFYRINKPDYTFGLAGTIGIDVPVGNEPITSETWNLHLGLFSSLRQNFNSFDFNVSYLFNGLNTRGNIIIPGNKLSLDLAYTRQIIIGTGSDITFAPVLELKFINTKTDVINDNNLKNNGESVLFLAPGFKITISSIIFESLVLFPVWQEQEKNKMQFNIMGLIGIRYMY